MTIEERIANLPQEFYDDELEIINNSPRLTNLIVETIFNNLHLCSEEVFECFNEPILQALLERDANTIHYHYLENTLEKRMVSTQEVMAIIKETNLTHEQEEYFKEKVRKAFQDKSLTATRFAGTEPTIKEMLKYERFDLISKVRPEELDADFVEELWNIYPFEKYPFPKIFFNIPTVYKKHMDEYPLLEELQLYISIARDIEYDEIEDAEEQIKLLPLITKSLHKKVSQLEKLDLTSLNLSSGTFSAIVPSQTSKEVMSEETRNEMLEIALKLYHLGLKELVQELLTANLITKEEARPLLIEFVKTGNIKTMRRIRFSMAIPYFKDDKELATLLLEKGFVEEAEQISNEIIEEKKSYIIEELNKKNKTFERFAYTLEYLGTKNNIELYLAMLNSGFTKRIITKKYWKFYDEDIEQLREILINYPDIQFDLSYLKKEERLALLPAFIKTNRFNCIVDLLRFNTYEDSKDLFKRVNQDNIITNLIRNHYKEAIELLSDCTRTIIQIPEILDEYLKDDKYIMRLVELVNHNEDLQSFYTIENYHKIKKYLSSNYSIPVETLDKLQEITGPLIIRYIDNENIQEILRLPEEELSKILALFPKEEYTTQDLRASYDSLKQYEFSKKCETDVQIFPTLLHAIEDKQDDIVEKLTEKIASSLDSNFLKNFLKKYEIPDTYQESNIIDLVRLVVEKIKISNGEKLYKYQTILHEMTDYYISKKREEYRDTYNMEEELKLQYDLEEKSVDRAVIKHIIMNSYHIYTNYYKKNYYDEIDEFESYYPYTYNPHAGKYTLYEYIVCLLEEKGIAKKLAEETIDYYIKRNKNSCRDFTLVQQTIPILIKVVKDIATISSNDLQSIDVNDYGLNKSVIDSYIMAADYNKEIKRLYRLAKDNNIFEILTRLNITALRQDVLAKPEVYESLLNTMKKRKLHLVPKNISKILGTEYLNISSDLTNLSGFISYYGAIYDSVKRNLEANGKSSEKILLNITNILIYAEVYSGMSSVYSQILGSEDAKLIKANPGPNAASRKIVNDRRLKEAIERTKKLYERQEVTIPTFEEDINLSDDKKMHVVVGNFTNPCNLTHGERTGACMRIGGVGESLFEFALDNPNGFHIRFEDPKTHEYISRVTGFRNGNTVFLNELRDSCNKDKYSNEDVIKACQKTAEMLIELSKNSSCPIENVVVHRAYATKYMKAYTENLGVTNIKEGLPQFYTDVGSSAIVLATTATNGKFVPLNFDKSKVPTYKTLREKPRITKSIQEAINKINRVNSVKKLLAGEDYEYIEPCDFSNGLIYAIVSNDWYIYVDEQGNIHHGVIDIDPIAKEELATALIEVEKNISQIKADNQEAKYGIQ